MGLAHRVGLVCCLVVLLSGPVAALDAIDLQLGELLGPDWQVAGATASLQWSASGTPSLDITLPRVELPPPLGPLTTVSIRCATLVIDAAQFACRKGTLRGQSELLQQVRGGLALEYRRSDGHWQLVLADLDTGHGRYTLELKVVHGQWQADIQPQGVALDGLVAVAARWPALALPEGLSGTLSGSLALAGEAATVTRLSADLRAEQLSFSNATGTQAGEGLRATLTLSARSEAGKWQFDAGGVFDQGQWYAEPLYWDFAGGAPVSWQARGMIAPDAGSLQLAELRWHQPDALTLQGALALHWEPEFALDDVDVAIEQARLPAAFETYLQPWLAESSFAQLATGGGLRGRVALADGALSSLSLELRDVTVNDSMGRLALQGVSASLDWVDDGESRIQQLRWEAGQLYRVALGAASLQLATQGRSVRLVAPVQLPVLDGQLWMDSFELDARQGMQWSLNAALTPISMPALTAALEWPEMGGTLSGMVPDVRYDNGQLTVGGTLLVGAFDGDITVRNLRMAAPLSTVPRLWADVTIDNLDLDTLTRTFSFGKIEGRLDGAVQDLYLQAWRPVAFDAWFATPADDRSRHRISQKAVDNLSSIGGGGVGGALSRSFLRFLDDFPYRAIGLRCRLANGVCEMGGVAPAQQGYYLVQGRVLPPRIDVIGYEDQVDWTSLVQRLEAVTGSEGPVVQ